MARPLAVRAGRHRRRDGGHDRGRARRPPAALGTVAATLRGLATAAIVCGVPAVVCFGIAGVAIDPLPAAAAGLMLYGAVLAVWRPAGLRTAWVYVRGLQ